MTETDGIRFAERDPMPASWLIGGALVTAAVLVPAMWLLEGEVAFDGRIVNLTLFVLAVWVVFALYIRRVRVEVTDDQVRVVPSMLRMERDDIHRVFPVAGADLKRLRKELTPSVSHVHCTPWRRTGVWILVRRGNGPLEEYVLGIRDTEGFRAALDRPWDDVATAAAEDLRRPHRA